MRCFAGIWVCVCLLWLADGELSKAFAEKNPQKPASAPASRPVKPQKAAPASRPVKPRKAATAPQERAAILRRVAAIHGAPGPFAVAGYLMGVYAQRHWKEKYGGWRLLVRHFTPAKVQWSCIADGIQAATGVSAGKLNLQMRFVVRRQMRTIFIHKPTQKKLTFRLKPSFIRRYLNTPRRQLRRAGAEILALPFEAIFTVTK